ncbi:hypothetical protein AAC387_Pa06g0182 [Persea americana]
MATPETTHSVASKLQMVAMQTVVPAKITDPGQRRRISGQTRPEMYKEHFHMVLYYNKAHEEEDGWVLTGWIKDSLSRSLSEEPMLAGRLQRSPDNNEGEMAIALNDTGVRLVNAQMEATVSEFLNSEERGDVEAQLAFWKDVDEQNPHCSALFYVQVTSFQGDGYSIGITSSLLLADPILITSFIHKWTSTLNNIITENNPNIPKFFFPNFRSTAELRSPVLTPSPCNPIHYQTTIYKLTGAPEQSHAYKKIAALAFGKAGEKLSTISVIFIDRSGDRKVSTFKREEEGLDESIRSLEGVLSPTSWDDLRGEEVSFYKGNMPVCVSYHIVSKPDEGIVMIMPPLEEGSLETTISITVPN